MTPGDSCTPARLTARPAEPISTPARLTTTPARLMTTPARPISQLSTHGDRLLTERLATAGARGYHYRVLAALEEFGPASQASLGRRTAMDRSDVVAAVNDLARLELVRRTPDAADRRRNVITITPAGLAHLQRLDGLLAEVQDELLAPLSPAERDQLTRLLGRLLAHHSGAQPVDRLPLGNTTRHRKGQAWIGSSAGSSCGSTGPAFSGTTGAATGPP